MATVNLFLREPKAEHDTPIVMRINDTINGSKVQIKIPTGEKINFKHWDQAKQKPRGNNRPELHQYLKDLTQKAKEEYLKFKGKGIIPEASAIREAINPKQIKPSQDPNDFFYETYKNFIEVQSQLQDDKTIRKYNSLLTSLKDFEVTQRLKLSFEEMNLRFYESYKIYLLNRSSGRYGEKGLVNDTIAKYISTLKTYLAWAYERKYHTSIEFRQFKASRKAKNDIVTLTEDELLAIYNLDLSKNKRLERVRDLFCFGTFTGQRWSDIEAYNKENITKDYIWDFISVKTKKQMQIPLIGFAAVALDILRKYEFQLPTISSQNFNDYIKEVGQLAGINTEVIIKRYSGKKLVEVRKPKYKFMSSHMARRSFVTLLLQKGVPPTTIMKLTGHTDLKTLMKYENTSHEAAIKALEQVGRIGKNLMQTLNEVQ